MVLRSFRADMLALCFGAFGAATVLGVSVSIQPWLGALPPALLGALLLARYAFLRPIALVAASLVTLQSSQDLTTAKVAYLAVVGWILLVSAPDAWRAAREGSVERRLLLYFALIGLALLPLTLIVARIHGIDVSLWLRDVAPYALFLASPIVAMGSRSGSRDYVLVGVLIVGGLFSGAGFASQIINRRHLLDESLQSWLFPSFNLAAATFCYAVSAAVHYRPRRLLWVGCAAASAGLILVTGTRTAILLALPLVVIAAGGRVSMHLRLWRLVATAGALGVIFLALSWLLANTTGFDFNTVVARFSSLGQPDAISAGDASYRVRLLETQLAFEAFQSAPLIGSGPGELYYVSSTFQPAFSALTLDSPLGILAKFGVFGTVYALIYWFMMVRCVTALRPSMAAATVARHALIGYGVLATVFLIVASPVEDKGFSLGLLLLLSIAFMDPGSVRAPTAAPNASGSKSPRFTLRRLPQGGSIAMSKTL